MHRFARLALLLSCTAPLACGGGAEPGSTSSGGGASPVSTSSSSSSSSSSASSGTGGAGGEAPLTPECVASASRGFCHLEGARLATATLEGAVGSTNGISLAASGLASGTDDAKIYSGGSYVYGTITTADLDPHLAFDSAVVSWNAETPDGTWIAVEASSRIGAAWTAWYRLGVWASGGADVTRHSFDGEKDVSGHVATDTIVLKEKADALRIRVTLFSVDGTATPTLRRIAVALADTVAPKEQAKGGLAWGTVLDVPGRSQMVFADGGEVWCSPTSTSMIMDYWSKKQSESAWSVPVPTAAAGTFDVVYGGNGNWPFNVAYAASLGLDGAVGWFAGVSDLEPWIAAGVPLAVSAAWSAGELDNAPITSTSGHLIVVVGFDDKGNVVVNDPAAASDAAVRRTYARDQFEQAWLGGSGGVVYEIFPPGWKVPWN